MFQDTSLDSATRAAKLEELHAMKEAERRQKRERLARQRKEQAELKVRQRFKRLVQKLVNLEREEHERKRSKAVEFIQQIWRHYCSWKEKRWKELLCHSATILQCMIRRRMAWMRLQETYSLSMTKSAIVIQKAFRRHSAILFVESLKLYRHFSAREIQRLFRGHQGRMKALRTLLSFAAVKLQSHVRRIIAQKFSQDIRFRSNEKLHQSCETKKMGMEDELSSLIEATEREMIRKKREKKVIQEKEHLKKVNLAKKHGIILLPWRKKHSNLASLLEQQRIKNLSTSLIFAKQPEVENKRKYNPKKARFKAEEYRKQVIERLRAKTRTSRNYRVCNLKDNGNFNRLENVAEETSTLTAIKRIDPRLEEDTNTLTNFGVVTPPSSCSERLDVKKLIRDRKRKEASIHKELMRAEAVKEEKKLEFLRKLEDFRKRQLIQYREGKLKQETARKQQEMENNKQQVLLHSLAAERRHCEFLALKKKLRKKVESEKELNLKKEKEAIIKFREEEIERKRILDKKAKELRAKIIHNFKTEFSRTKEHRKVLTTIVKKKTKKQIIKKENQGDSLPKIRANRPKTKQYKNLHMREKDSISDSQTIYLDSFEE